MKIGILGAGNIGGTIGRKWAAAGHSIQFGVRDPRSEKTQALIQSIDGDVRAVTPAAAAAFGEVLLFAVPGSAVAVLAAELGDLLDDKIIIDATNRIGQPEMNNIAILSAQSPHGRFYRAFNSSGWENFENPQIDGVQIDQFYCGAPGESQPVVDRLIADVGLRPVYTGGLEQVEVIDQLTRLWFALASGRGYGRRLAFKLLKETGE